MQMRTAGGFAGDALLMMLMRNGVESNKVKTDLSCGKMAASKEDETRGAQTESAASCFNRLILA